MGQAALGSGALRSSAAAVPCAAQPLRSAASHQRAPRRGPAARRRGHAAAAAQRRHSSGGAAGGPIAPATHRGPLTPPRLPWLVPTGLPAQVPATPIAQDSVITAEEHQVSYAHVSKYSNAPRILGAENFKKIVPYQKSVWSVKAEDVAPDEDALAEAPQHELAKVFARDQLAPLDTIDVFVMEQEREQERHRAGRLRALWLQAKRSRHGKVDQNGLWVRDESYWEWWVKDNYGFYGRPRHLTWEEFATELRSVGLFWELHPTKPEDFIILHLIRGEGEDRRVVWSAEHAAWEPPVFMDLWAAVGTMLSRRLKTRTLSFDNGRGTIKELNIRHVGPWTSALQVNGRPGYHYDPVLRERREKNSSWFFSKELVAQPGQDDEGTVSFFVSAQALAYHLCIATSALLNRPMWTFFRRARRRSAHNKQGLRRGRGGTGVAEAFRGWCGFDDHKCHDWPSPNQLEAITDHWLEESPFPLVSVWDRVRQLAKLPHVNLDLRQFVDQNKRLTTEAVRELAARHAPQLLLAAGDAADPADRGFLASGLRRALRSYTEDELYHKQRQSVYVPPPPAAPAALDAPAAAAPESPVETAEEEFARKGRERQEQREAELGSARDSEAWEWIAREEKAIAQASPPEVDVSAVDSGRLASLGVVRVAKRHVVAEL
eukprot:TRINITY_DN5651_c0_g1_i1.p1 TRINITY_DN5651_c0_g1~~TRINITY_DN5651_c0_g1_i1.p1  ORF type:complete len:756 (+),score=188.98 TRINITY_DN5651_c0_g1_i1:291-2270(+)